MHSWPKTTRLQSCKCSWLSSDPSEQSLHVIDMGVFKWWIMRWEQTWDCVKMMNISFNFWQISSRYGYPFSKIHNSWLIGNYLINIILLSNSHKVWGVTIRRLFLISTFYRHFQLSTDQEWMSRCQEWMSRCQEWEEWSRKVAEFWVWDSTRLDQHRC